MTRNSDTLSYSLDGKLNQIEERKGKMDKICFLQVTLKKEDMIQLCFITVFLLGHSANLLASSMWSE